MIERITFGNAPNGTAPPRFTAPNGGTTATVQSGRLTVAGSGAAGGYLLWKGHRAPALAGEISGEVTFSSTTQDTILAIIGADPVSAPAATEWPYGYGLQFLCSTGAVSIRELDGGGASAAGPFTVTANTTDPFRFRLQRINGRIRAKVWNATNREAGWNLDVAAAKFVGALNNSFGLSHYQQVGSTSYAWLQFDDLNIPAAALL